MLSKNSCKRGNINDKILLSECLGLFSDGISLFIRWFAVIATHFRWMFESEKDNEQRLRNVDQFKEICDFIIEKYNGPVFVGGDLNNGKNSEQGEESYKYMIKQGFSDVRFSAEETTD